MLASQNKSTIEGDGTCTPFPVSETVVGELDASLVRETLPVTFPAVEGVRVTLKVAVSPGDRFRGRLSPATLKSAPFTLTPETRTTVVPELVAVTFRVSLLPNMTSPKLMLVGLRVRIP